MPFLGHIVGKCKLCMNMTKVKAILEWEPPTKAIKLRSFLDLVNYYRQFVKGYYALATPLMDFLKKGIGWLWAQECPHTFASFEEGHYRGDNFSTSRPLQVIWDLRICFWLFHWWYLDARRSSHPLWELEAQWHREVLHSARERNDGISALSPHIEAVLGREQVHHQDQ